MQTQQQKQPQPLTLLDAFNASIAEYYKAPSSYTYNKMLELVHNWYFNNQISEKYKNVLLAVLEQEIRKH